MVLNLLGFGFLDLIFDVIFSQQKVLDVLGSTFTSDLGSVIFSVLLALLADFGSGGDLDLDLLDWLFIAFEAHAVYIQIFEVGEDFLLTTSLYDKFISFVDHTKLKERLVLVVFVLVNWESLLPCWQLSPSDQKQEVEQVFNSNTAIVLTFQ
jgi:hypothetical protein